MGLGLGLGLGLALGLGLRLEALRPALATIATSAGLRALAARLVTCGIARWMRACV